MLKLNSQDVVGLTAYWADDKDPLQYYALPGEPTIAVRDGKPVFKYVKYRNPIERPGGVKGGGLLVMQAELALPAKDEAEIRRRIGERLKAQGIPSSQASNVKLGRPGITRGKVTLIVAGEGGSGLVQKVHAPTAPSLYGNNVVSLAVELNEFGAPVFEAALKGQGASLVIVGYELGFSAQLPPAHLLGTWNASAFAHFSQTINEDWHYLAEDSYEETINDYMSKNEASLLEWIEQPTADGMSADAHQKMKLAIQDSINQQLQEGIKRNILAEIPPESRDVEQLRERGIEDIKRTVNSGRVASVRVEYKEKMVVEIPANPNAPLKAFGSMVVGGKALKWEDYAITVDADDPFFKSFAANFMINADFADLPIANVIAQVSYKGKTGQGTAKTYSFKKPDDQYRFESFYDGGDGEFTYNYEVSYKGQSKTFKSGPHKSKADVSLNVGDLGVWKVDIDVGDINFDDVKQAQLTCFCNEGEVKKERTFVLTDKAPSHKIRDVIFKPRTEPWTYQVKYIMKDGREITVKDGVSNGDQLVVNDPFSASKTVSIRTKGDFANVIDQLFLDFEYDDSANGYRQSQSFAFSQDGTRFTDWTFPVINEKQGTLSYTGQIVYRDGRPPLQIGPKTLIGNTVLEGEDVQQIKVDLVADLLDWDKLKLVMVKLKYLGETTDANPDQSYKLTEGAQPDPWIVNVKDRTKKSYEVKAQFFPKEGGPSKTVVIPSTEDEALVLEMPA
jgi:hypothetical protein